MIDESILAFEIDSSQGNDDEIPLVPLEIQICGEPPKGDVYLLFRWHRFSKAMQV